MKNLFLGTFDEAYAEKLARRLTGTVPFPIRIYTDPQRLMTQLTLTEESSILLAPAMFLLELGQVSQDVLVLTLTQDPEEEGVDGYAVYQFQPSDALLQQLLSCLSRAGVLPSSAEEQKETKALPQARLLGLYSPIRRCGQTALALSLGLRLSRSQKTLYVNLEDYHGFESLMHRGGGMDLSDLLYRIRQMKGDGSLEIGPFVRTFGTLDYIPPAFSCVGLREVATEEWMNVLSLLAQVGSYGTIVLDLGANLGQIFRLLEPCDRVIVPILEDPWSRAKLAQFEKELMETGRGSLKQRMELVRVPLPSAADLKEYPEALEKGSIGRLAGKLMAMEVVDGSI